MFNFKLCLKISTRSVYVRVAKTSSPVEARLLQLLVPHPYAHSLKVTPSKADRNTQTQHK